MKEKVFFNWSGGKDSALCLYKILQKQQYEVLCLLTSVSEEYNRVSMHGVRSKLLVEQAESIGLPLLQMKTSEMPTMESYEKAMTNMLTDLKNQGVTTSVFGDIFLEDLRTYRENQLSKLDLKCLFPLWKISTKKLIQEFIDVGFKTIVTCINEKYLDKSFVGRIIDDNFLKDLPENVDPCGENGEFHTFVFDGPIFKKPIQFKKGEIVYRKYSSDEQKENTASEFSNNGIDNTGNPFDNGFWYCDLL